MIYDFFFLIKKKKFMKSKVPKLKRLYSFAPKFGFSSTEDPNKNLTEKTFQPQESVYDLSVAQKYIIGNIK